MKRQISILLGSLTVSACLALPALNMHAQSGAEASGEVAALKSETSNCFSIIAGRNATTDGSVLFGHNEDGGDDMMLNMNISSYGIWGEFPGMSVSDGFMNKYGVCIASDGCGSREDRKDYTGKGVVYELRMNVFREAVSARDAVRIIAREVETYGYRASGRTYMVADRREGWLVSVVQGRHWVAQRVPDDMVASIPNYYLIGEVDLSDTVNFMACNDLIDYAVKRGWYDPEADGKFNFRNVYAKQSTLTSSHNVPRHTSVLKYLGYEYDIDNVPFAVVPKQKVDVRAMREMLGQHSEPHPDGSHPARVCNFDTNASIIFQLRSWLPISVGCVMWVCPGKVCTEVHIPWYLGMTKSPEGFQRFATVQEAFDKHFSDGNTPVDGLSLRQRYPGGIYWIYVDRWEKINSNYAKLIKSRSRSIRKMQERIFSNQLEFENKVLEMSPADASAEMNAYTESLVKQSVR